MMMIIITVMFFIDMISFGHHFFRGMGDNPEENGSPKAKRKKELTRNEILLKLKANEEDVSKAVEELMEELCPFDINDEEALKIKGRVERFQMHFISGRRGQFLARKSSFFYAIPILSRFLGSERSVHILR